MTSICSQCSSEVGATCAQCGADLCEAHALVGQPLITARQLIATIVSTALHAPGLLGEVLFKELDQVAYCPGCREAVAGRRQTEQLKFAAGLLLVVVLFVGLPLLLYVA